MEGQRQHHEVIRSDHHRGGNGAATGSVAKGNGIIMTDEQLETLRKQIALYAVICNKLAETHKNLTATKPQQDTVGGVRLGNTSVAWAPGHKFSSRPRWNPTPTQIQTLERIFNEGSGLPSKQKIKEIASQLSQHGQISETNVYNWFQNRRARSKRRKLQQAAAAVADAEDLEEMGDDGSDSIKTNNNGASKVEIEKANLEDLLLITHQQSPAASRVEDLCFQSPEICAELLHFVDSQNPEVESMFPSDGSLSHDTRNLGRKSFQDITRSSSGNRHSTGDSGS